MNRSGHKEFLSTGQVSRLLGIAPKTVCNLVDSGKIEGTFIVPGGKDRRIPITGLVKYLRANNAAPLADRMLRHNGVLILGAPKIKEAIDARGVYTIHVSTPFHFGFELAKAIPPAVVLDGNECGLSTAIDIARHCHIYLSVPYILVVLTADCGQDMDAIGVLPEMHTARPDHNPDHLASLIKTSIYTI